MHSLRDTASDPGRVEVCVIYDPDDPETGRVARELECQIVVEAPTRWGYRRLHEYFNALVSISSGDWLMLWNDDAVMQTDGWDDVIASESPGVLSLRSNFRDLDMFPVAHRRVVDAMGHFSLSNHNDSWLHDVAVGAGCLRGVDVYVHHDRFDLTGNNQDDVYRASSTGYTTMEYYGLELHARRGLDVERVRAALDEFETSTNGRS